MASVAPQLLESEKPGSRATREAVLDAAERLFAERGFEATSLNDVGAAAGVSRGTPGYFFGSKADLYRAVLERCFSEVRSAVRSGRERALASGESADKVLAGIVSDYFDFITANPYFVRLIEWEALTGGRTLEEVPPHVEAAQEALAALSDELGARPRSSGRGGAAAPQRDRPLLVPAGAFPDDAPRAGHQRDDPGISPAAQTPRDRPRALGLAGPVADPDSLAERETHMTTAIKQPTRSDLAPKTTEQEARDVAEAARETGMEGAELCPRAVRGELRPRPDPSLPRARPGGRGQGQAASWSGSRSSCATRSTATRSTAKARSRPRSSRVSARWARSGIKIPEEYGGMGLSQYSYTQAIGAGHQPRRQHDRAALGRAVDRRAGAAQALRHRTSRRRSTCPGCARAPSRPSR